MASLNILVIILYLISASSFGLVLGMAVAQKSPVLYGLAASQALFAILMGLEF